MKFGWRRGDLSKWEAVIVSQSEIGCKVSLWNSIELTHIICCCSIAAYDFESGSEFPETCKISCTGRMFNILFPSCMDLPSARSFIDCKDRVRFPVVYNQQKESYCRTVYFPTVYRALSIGLKHLIKKTEAMCKILDNFIGCKIAK